MKSSQYSDEAQYFLGLARKYRDKLTPEIRAQIILRDLKEWEKKIIPDAEGVFDALLASLGPGGEFEECSGDEARAGFMTEGGSIELTLWCGAIAYSADAIKLYRNKKESRAWDSVVEATQMNSILTGLLAGRGDADAQNRLKLAAAGKKGGSAPKKHKWAISLAKEVRQRWPGKTKEELWDHMKNQVEFEIQTDENNIADRQSFDVNVFEDCVSAHRLGDGKKFSLKRSSFEKRYL